MMVPATRDNMGSIEDLITSSIPAGESKNWKQYQYMAFFKKIVVTPVKTLLYLLIDDVDGQDIKYLSPFPFTPFTFPLP